MENNEKKLKKPTTLKGWQKLYPDAVRITGTGKVLLSNTQLLKLALCEEGKGKVLADKSWATWSVRTGTIVNINAIVSPSGLSLSEINAKQISHEQQ